MALNRIGPPCPECGSLTTDVERTLRSSEGHFLRKRICPSCGHRFSTLQHTEIVAPPGSFHGHTRRVSINWRVLRSYFAKLVASC